MGEVVQYMCVKMPELKKLTPTPVVIAKNIRNREYTPKADRHKAKNATSAKTEIRKYKIENRRPKKMIIEKPNIDTERKN